MLRTRCDHEGEGYLTSTLKELVPAGVILGDDAQKVFAYAKGHQFALPGVNCTGTNTVNAALETAAELGSPMIIQFSNGGAAFYAGKGLSNTGQRAAVAGAISGAMHIHQLAESYGARVMVHTDHCAKRLLPWVDGLLLAGEAYHKEHGRPLFSSHSSICRRHHSPRTSRPAMGILGRHQGILRQERGLPAGQIGNPKGPDEPNKKYCDRRAWLRAGEESFKARLRRSFEELNNVS